jgi:hypothetical protein
MLATFEKYTSDWALTYHFDNEKEEFINDDTHAEIITIFDSINIQAKRDLFKYFFILPSSDEINLRTVALSYMSESLNEFDEDKKIVSVPLTQRLVESIRQTKDPKILFTLIHNLALVLETRDDVRLEVDLLECLNLFSHLLDNNPPRVVCHALRAMVNVFQQNNNFVNFDHTVIEQILEKVKTHTLSSNKYIKEDASLTL